MEETPCCGVCRHLSESPAAEAEADRDLRWHHACRIVCGDQGVVLSEASPVCRIGRSRDCELRLNDSKISRYQSTFEWRGGQVWVSDNRSGCGTLLNGAMISRARVGPGDEIWVGDSRITVSEQR